MGCASGASLARRGAGLPPDPPASAGRTLSTEAVYAVTSLTAAEATPARLPVLARAHWGIANPPALAARCRLGRGSGANPHRRSTPAARRLAQRRPHPHPTPRSQPHSGRSVQSLLGIPAQSYQGGASFPTETLPTIRVTCVRRCGISGEGADRRRQPEPRSESRVNRRIRPASSMARLEADSQ